MGRQSSCRSSQVSPRRARHRTRTEGELSNLIIEGDFEDALASVPAGSCRLIYIDPPYNTGMTQRLGKLEYKDRRTADEWNKFIRKAVDLAALLLTDDGSLFIHCDWHCCLPTRCIVEHGVEVGGKTVNLYMGQEKRQFTLMNEIIWAYDYGGRSKTYWSRKHDNLLWYVKDPKNYVFNFDEMDRIPYMAPGLVGKEKAARGKTPVDVWWHTIVPTNGKERTGYPTQKPLGVLERIVKVHSNPSDTVLDFFAGSGTTGDAAARNNRSFILVDRNSQAIDVMGARLEYANPKIDRVASRTENP